MKEEKDVKKRNGFSKSATGLLHSIGQVKRELRETKSCELKTSVLAEKEKIKLVKQRARLERKAILVRYVKAKERLGVVLLSQKNKGLMGRLSVEKKTLNKAVKGVDRVRKNRERIKKSAS